MKKLIAGVGALLICASALMAQNGSMNSAARGNRQRQQTRVTVQQRSRIHQPGTGQQTGDLIRKRDRKRDGTGVNCPIAPCTNPGTQKQQVGPASPKS